MIGNSFGRTSSGNLQTTATGHTSHASGPTPVAPPTPEDLVEHCLHSLGQADRSRTVSKHFDGQTWEERVTVEMDMRALYHAANKVELDVDTIVRGLEGLAEVIKQGEALLPHSQELSHAQAFINSFNQYYALTDSMKKAQAIIQRCQARDSGVRVPFDV